MRSRIPAALVLLLAACATVPPLRPADPAQAVAHERSAATAVAEGIRIIVRPEAWQGYRGDLDQHFLPIEVAIHNGSGRAVDVQPASFSLLAPDGFRYQALSTEDVRHAFAPFRGSPYAYGYSFYASYPWSGPYYASGRGGYWAWGPGPGPYPGTYPYVGAYPYYGYGYSGLPPNALAKGTLEAGGKTSVLVFFPVAGSKLKSVELDATLVDTAGQSVAQLRVPFVRGGQPVPTPLPPIAAPPQPQGQSPAWETVPPQQQAPPAEKPQVDTPVGPPVEAPPPTR